MLRRLIPYAIRVELARLKRLPMWWAEMPTIARMRVDPKDAGAYSFRLACHSSPLERSPGAVEPGLQRGKEHNVAVAARLLDGLLIGPNKIFSYHHVVGRPSRPRGFRVGLELHNGIPSRGVGGGCCQVSNALYLVALRAGLRIVERHRHGLDLFPDHDRTVPFGCGATVFFNYADLRFENPLPYNVLLKTTVQDRTLTVQLWTTEDPGWTTEIYEVDHRFFREGEDRVMRENRIRRRFLRTDGSVMLDHEVAHNSGRVLYEPPEDWERPDAPSPG